MFAQYAASPRRFPVRAAAFSFCFHVGAIALVLISDSRVVKTEAPVELTFFKAPPRPPPLPPPPAPRASAPKHAARIEPARPIPVPTRVPEVVNKAPPPEPKAPPAEPSTAQEPAPEGVPGGTEGGVPGGVVGGLVGGDSALARAKPKNVPAFVIQRDMLQQTPLRLPEVFKQAHRGERFTGMYKVCVGGDGHVYEVGVVKSVPGADDAIVAGIQEGWLYKPQQVPVCFLYNMPISVQ